MEIITRCCNRLAEPGHHQGGEHVPRAAEKTVQCGDINSEQTWGPIALGGRTDDGQEVRGWAGGGAGLMQLEQLYGGDDDMGYGVYAVNCGDSFGESGEGGDLNAGKDSGRVKLEVRLNGSVGGRGFFLRRRME